MQSQSCGCSPIFMCLLLAGSVGLELAAGRDGKAVGSENGHYQVRKAALTVYIDLKASSCSQLPSAKQPAYGL